MKGTWKGWRWRGLAATGNKHLPYLRNLGRQDEFNNGLNQLYESLGQQISIFVPIWTVLEISLRV